MRPILLLICVVTPFLVIPDVAKAQLLIESPLGMMGDLGRGSLPQQADSKMIEARLKMQGYANVRVSPANPREVYADSPAGMPVKLIMDPTTGQIISAVPQ